MRELRGLFRQGSLGVAGPGRRGAAWCGKARQATRSGTGSRAWSRPRPQVPQRRARPQVTGESRPAIAQMRAGRPQDLAQRGLPGFVGVAGGSLASGLMSQACQHGHIGGTHRDGTGAAGRASPERDLAGGSVTADRNPAAASRAVAYAGGQLRALRRRSRPGRARRQASMRSRATSITGGPLAAAMNRLPPALMRASIAVFPIALTVRHAKGCPGRSTAYTPSSS